MASSNAYDNNTYVVNNDKNEFDSTIPVNDNNIDRIDQNTVKESSNSRNKELDCCCTVYRWELFLHGCCIIAGIWCFIAGLVGFGTKYTDFQDIIIYCYLIFFGVLIVFFEFKQPAIIYSLIGFYDNFHGRTFFFILVGGLPLGRSDVMDVAGTFILVISLILLFFSLTSFCPACFASWDLPDGIPVPIFGLAKSLTEKNESESSPKQVDPEKTPETVPETKLRGPANLPPPPPEPTSWTNPDPSQQINEPKQVSQQGSAYYNTSTMNNEQSDDEQLGVWGNRSDNVSGNHSSPPPETKPLSNTNVSLTPELAKTENKMGSDVDENVTIQNTKPF